MIVTKVKERSLLGIKDLDQSEITQACYSRRTY